MLHYITFMTHLLVSSCNLENPGLVDISSQCLKHLKMHNSLPHGGNSLYQIYIMSGSLIRLFIYYILCVACSGVGLRKGTLGDIAWEQRESPPPCPRPRHQSLWTLGTYKSLKDMLLLLGNQNSGKLWQRSLSKCHYPKCSLLHQSNFAFGTWKLNISCHF